MADVKYIASVSFGKDSLAMLLRLIEEHYPLNAVLFYDTGMEFDSIYKNRDKVKKLLEHSDIEFVELHPSEPFLYSMLDKKIKYRGKDAYHFGYGWCGGPCRWGTTFKQKAIAKYKKLLNDHVFDYVGIAADEQKRFEKAKSEGKRMPLVEWGMSEQDCLAYCRQNGFHWTEQVFNNSEDNIDLYDILDRVSCWCCTNKNLNELRNMYLYLPQYWSRLLDLQTRIPAPMKGNGCSVFDLERRFKAEKEWLDAGRNIKSRPFYDYLKQRCQSCYE